MLIPAYLTLLDMVRRRPGMYIGNTDFLGTREMVLALVRAARRRYANQNYQGRIAITLYNSHSARVEDYGTGVPLQQIPTNPPLYNDIIIEEALQEFRAIPVLWIMALSSHFVCVSHHEGQPYRQQLFRGQPIKSLRYLSNSGTPLTYRHFTLDPTIFKADFPPFKNFLAELSEVAACTPGLDITLTDHRTAESQRFYYPNGMADFVRALWGISSIRIHAKIGDDSVDIAFGVATERAGVWGFALGGSNPEGGTHVKGMEQGIMQVVRGYAKTKGLDTKGKRPTVYDLRKKLVAVVSVWMPDAYYNRSTKVEYATPRAKSLVQRLIVKELPKRFDENPALAKAIIDALYEIK